MRTFSPVILLLVLGIIFNPLAAQDFIYQTRSNGNDTYSEGIKPRPVAGYDLELLSARIDVGAGHTDLPQRLSLRFLRSENAPVSITVREVDNQHFYWLDQVTPGDAWRNGVNAFVWPTNTVLGELGLTVDDLGVVVRLDREVGTGQEYVAPAVLGDLPDAVDAYLFTFKTNGDARLRARFYPERSDEAIFQPPIIQRQRGGRPFSVYWPVGSAPSGWYRLVMDGYFLRNSQPVSKVVSFFHQPRLP